MRQNKQGIEFGIIGLGRFGYNLAISLAEAGKEVMVIDKEDLKIRQIKEYVDEAFIVKNLDKDTLEETGIQNCSNVIISLSKKIDVSILTVLNIINMGVPRVIAKAATEEHGAVLEKIGAEVIYPERDMAIKLSKKLTNSKSIDFMKLTGEMTIVEFELPNTFVNRKIEECNLRKEFSLNIVAIESNGESITDIKPDYILKEKDLIVMVGTNKNILKFEKFIQKKDKI